MDWQDAAALAIVAVAAGYVARRAWRTMSPTSKSCGGCGTGCASASAEKPLVQISSAPHGKK